MNRRSLLATTAAVFVAGCTEVGGSSETVDRDDTGQSDRGGTAPVDEPTADSTADSIADPDHHSTDIVEVDAVNAGETVIEFAPNEVHVTGTVVGETGCHGVAVSDAAVDDNGEFRVVVEAVDDSDPGQLCTQALTEVGYELDATFEDGVPQSVTVVHDDAHGEETVASEEPDEEPSEE